MMQGKWIIELAELEVSTRAESDALKAFITRKVDEGRFAYGRLNGKYPRQSIFIASKNPAADGTYLKEEGGKRRWWPVACRPATKNGIVDFTKFKAVRNLLWAEVVEHVGKKGEELFMETDTLRRAALVVAESRHAEPPWAEAIGDWIDKLPDGDPRRGFLTARDVFVGALQGLEKQLDRRATTSIASAFRYLGWEPGLKRMGENSRMTRGYYFPLRATVKKIDLDKLINEL